ncbi:MAG TPA: hypothetical protein VFM88_02630 [Vicinamibacteria bacterium]|nr:hypothetical protein [Vicinamibacteria bacterium]
MKRSAAVVSALAFVALLPAGAAPADEKETFFATVVQTSNMRLPGGGTFQITMNVEQWTSLEERKRLLGVFKEGGSEALMKELRKQKAGYIVPPALARWPSWEVDVAASIPQPDGGRIVRLFTERPIAFGEAYYATRSKDYEFGIVELKLDAKGEGEGMTIPAAKLSMNEEGQIVVESTPFTTGPQRLMGVRQWKKKEKK